MMAPAQPLVCLILAAGEAKRFGGNKGLATVGDVPLLIRAVRLAQGVGPTYVALGAYAEANQQALTCAGANPHLIHCPEWSAGPGATLAYCARRIPRSAALLVLLADQCLLSAEDLKTLVQCWEQSPDQPVCAQYSDTIGAPAIFPASTRELLHNIPANAGAKQLLLRLPNLGRLSMANAAWDVDTPEDLARINQQIQNNQHVDPARSNIHG